MASTGWKSTRNPVDGVVYTDASQVASCHADDGVSDLLSRAPMCLSCASRGRPRQSTGERRGVDCERHYGRKQPLATKTQVVSLLYGREARLPSETALTSPQTSAQVDMDDYRTALLDGLSSEVNCESSSRPLQGSV